MYKCKFLEAGQLPQEHLPFLQNLLIFFITKYLKQVDDDLSIWVDKCSTCGLYNWRYKDLTIPRAQKVMTLLPALEKCSINFYHGVTFNSSSPYETQDKEIYHMMMS